ncbi:CUB and sushi domain-containing protein 3-like [Patiria miniata]|uniref:G-protein coupled receptor GRL101 n=1 Tax=Patiria miniata TaxID=46514 RepID=A0A913ZEN2_PATMI|nr:CUB and sushi domain-containing protein 3-like [Patiria miniata]
MAGRLKSQIQVLTIGILLAFSGAVEIDPPIQINLTMDSPVDIQSRNYPAKYPGNYVDTWLLVSPPDTLISVKVLDFQTEKHPVARDLLYIGNGLNYTSTVRYNLPRSAEAGTAGMVLQMISSGSEMWLQFSSDFFSSSNERGFQLRVHTINNTESCSPDEYICNEVITVCMDESIACDGPPQCSNGADETFCEHCGQTSIDLSQGVLYTVSSPKHPDDFPYEILCHWLINASDASSILISFDVFRLEENRDLFSIGIGHDPANESSIVLMRRGSVTPITIAIQSNQIWLEFMTMGSLHLLSLMQVTLQEFLPQDCAEGLAACDSGLECVQQTAVCNGFPDCSDQSDELNCDNCSAAADTCSCFKESYFCNGEKNCEDYYDELRCATCGDPFINLTGDTSVNFSSPNYPSKYPRELSCLWLVTAQPNHRILVNFVDFKLNVETLSLGNGHHPGNASSLILRRAGATSPRMVSSEGSTLWMTFETSTKTSLYRGFLLELSQFVAVECRMNEFACDSGHQCVENSSRCDDITDCWDFSDEIGCESCDVDKLPCMDGVCVEHDGICDGYADCEDFTDETGCGTLCGKRNILLTTEAPTYRLSSPDLDSTNLQYPPGYSCLWILSTDPQLQIALKVVDISLIGRGEDTIQIGNGQDPANSTSTLAILQGADDTPLVGRSFLSSESKMWVAMVTASKEIKFAKWGMFDLDVTRHNTSGECINGSWCRHQPICVSDSAVCDGISNCGDYSDEQHCAHCGAESTDGINVADGAPYLLTARLTSQGAEFPLGKDCLWIVTALAGTRIQLRFLYMILISDTSYFNGILVGDGTDPSIQSSLLLRHTGKVVRQVVTSSGSEVWIVADTFRLQFEEGFSVLLSQFNQTVCASDQYACPSGLLCIEQSQRCDGIPDCPGAGDEFGCAECSSQQLYCDGGRCVDSEHICDRKQLCQDRLDERICAPCGDSIITLPPDPDQQIIFSSPSYSVADYPFDMDCVWFLTSPGGYFIQLEFLDFKTEVHFDQFSVGNGHDYKDVSSAILSGISGEEAPRIILSDDDRLWIRFTADHFVTDRGFQLLITQVNDTVECNEAETSCESGPGIVCLPHESRCNGLMLCPDESDEQSCGICGSNIIYLFDSDTHNLTSPGFPGQYPPNQPCSWRIQTSDKPATEGANAWKILASIQIFDLENQYDYLTLYNWDEGGVTDLIARLTGNIKLTTVVSSGYAMFIKFTSDNTGSAKGFKIHFQAVNKTSKFCTGSDFDCNGEEFCVSEDAKCNGFNDCLRYQDETDCAEVNCPGNYMCDNEIISDDDLVDFQCVTLDLVCNGRTDCPEHDDEVQCDKKKCPSDCNCYYDSNRLVIKCLGSWEQSTVDNMAKTVATLSLNGGNVTVLKKGTFKGMNSLRTLSLSDNNIVTIETRTFDGLDNLMWLELSNNQIYELESYSFQELGSLEGLTFWNVPLQRVNDYAFTGLAKLQKLSIIRGVLDSPLTVAPKGFDGLHSLQTLYVDDHRLCCYFPDVTCTSIEPRPPLFMCSNLMPNLALRIFMWILGISALVGNFGIMIWRFREKNSKASRQVHSFLVFNLAVSDFFMGVYMLIIAAADVHYGDEYFMRASEWRSTVACKVASALSILSSEASVFIVTVITIDRFLCILFPFSQFHLRRHSSRVVLFIVWFVAISVSLIPTLLADEESNVYGLSDVCIGLPLQTRATDFASTTQDIESPFSNETFDIPVALNYQPSWVFSIVLFLGVNFVCFLVILVCYVVIFIQVQLSLKQVNRHIHRHEEIKMAGKMAIIVGTDLVCWLPIIIMGILAQSGVVTIPVEMYAWIVVFILPINSSLNPYLYTISSCVADRKRENMSTATTKRNGTLAMTNRANLDKSVQSQGISVVD